MHASINLAYEYYNIGYRKQTI